MLCSLNRFVDFSLQFTSLKPFFGTVRRKESRVLWEIQKSTQTLKEGMAFMESSFLFNSNNYKKKIITAADIGGR